MFDNLFKESYIGNLRIKNRLVMPAMSTNYASDSGEVTERLIRYYEERARHGVGLVIVENAGVQHPLGKNTVAQLSAASDRFMPGLCELAERIKWHGARAFLQLIHAGRQASPRAIDGQVAVAPSPIPCPVAGGRVRELTQPEIHQLVEAFAEAALRARRAGFDGVEIHGAHGYLVNQFVSPLTNKRVDRYGGSLEGRLTFPL